jgi:hypothetical protein
METMAATAYDEGRSFTELPIPIALKGSNGA